MKGYNKETGLPHVPPQKSVRKKKEPSEKRYTKSFSLSSQAIDFLKTIEEKLGKSYVSRYVDSLILNQITTVEEPPKAKLPPIPNVPEANQLLYDLYTSGNEIDDIAKSNGISVATAKRRIASVREPGYLKNR